ncbi:MAG: hypothetical protein ABI472_10010 [Ginsengibacter sp.]
MPSKGNSQVPVNYYAVVIDPNSGKIYRKLEVADKGETKDYGSLVNVLFSNKSKSFRIITDPEYNKLQIEFDALHITCSTGWRIINQRGQLIKIGIVSTINPGVNIPLLPAGTYSFQVQA